jgi:hypothetical protein
MPAYVTAWICTSTDGLGALYSCECIWGHYKSKIPFILDQFEFKPQKLWMTEESYEALQNVNY